MAGNEWGIPYKIVVGKMKPNEVLGLIGGAGEDGWERTARALLDGLIQDDRQVNETGYHADIRLEVWNIRPCNRRVRIDEARVQEAVWQCRSGKAPGWDEIMVEMINAGFDEIKDTLVRLYKRYFRKKHFSQQVEEGYSKDATEKRGQGSE